VSLNIPNKVLPPSMKKTCNRKSKEDNAGPAPSGDRLTAAAKGLPRKTYILTHLTAGGLTGKELS